MYIANKADSELLNSSSSVEHRRSFQLIAKEKKYIQLKALALYQYGMRI